MSADMSYFVREVRRFLPKEKRPLIRSVSIIREEVVYARVEGHTDNVTFEAKRRKEYGNNWGLGAARAVYVLKYMEKEGDSEKNIFSAASYGGASPCWR